MVRAASMDRRTHVAVRRRFALDVAALRRPIPHEAAGAVIRPGLSRMPAGHASAAGQKRKTPACAGVSHDMPRKQVS
jgi:hypothetical protein